jgi:hypothetical protein
VWSGIQSSSRDGNVKPFGMTPTMVAGAPLMRTAVPTTFGVPPKSRCQTP